MINETVDLATRTARELKVNVDSSYPGTIGGGFLFFEVDTLPAATACSEDLPHKDHATWEIEELKVAGKDTGFTGAKVTYTCDEGYKWGYEHVPITTTPAPPTPIKVLGAPYDVDISLPASQGTWGAWEEAVCPRSSCSPGALATARTCSTRGACRGDTTTCRELAGFNHILIDLTSSHPV